MINELTSIQHRFHFHFSLDNIILKFQTDQSCNFKKKRAKVRVLYIHMTCIE